MVSNNKSFEIVPNLTIIYHIGNYLIDQVCDTELQPSASIR